MARFLAGFPRGRMARWRSGYVEDCKSSHAGSIPARASNLLFALPAPPPVSAIQQAKCAALAQSVEHIIRNDGVRGSNPLSGTTTSLKDKD